MLNGRARINALTNSLHARINNCFTTIVQQNFNISRPLYNLNSNRYFSFKLTSRNIQKHEKELIKKSRRKLDPKVRISIIYI